MERRIVLPVGTFPDWPEIAGQLNSIGEAPALRMIDGQPAFPDEVPDPGWTELRVGLAGGIVTLRHQGSEFHCVCWGKDDPALVRSWNALAWAVATAGGGSIVEPGGRRDAASFRRDELAGPG